MRTDIFLSPCIQQPFICLIVKFRKMKKTNDYEFVTANQFENEVQNMERQYTAPSERSASVEYHLT